MANPLRVRRLPEQLAERGQAIEIVESLSYFDRLAAIVDADLGALPAARIPPRWRESPVTIALQFGWADARERLPCVTGRLAARIDAVCQRCLDPCTLPLETDVRLLLVSGEGEDTGDADFEIWELDDDTVRPIDIVEELLIMALPMAARHASAADCGSIALPGTAPVSGETERPFAGLRDRLDDTK